MQQIETNLLFSIAVPWKSWEVKIIGENIKGN